MGATFLIIIAAFFLWLSLYVKEDSLYSLISFSMAAICYGFAKVVWTLERQSK